MSRIPVSRSPSARLLVALATLMVVNGCASSTPGLVANSAGYLAQGSGDGRITFGIQICAPPGVNVWVTDIQPLAWVGSGFDVLGFRLASYDAPGGITVATSGFPPAIPTRPGEQVYAVGDHVAVQPCESAQRLSEVQVGLARRGPSGGGLSSVRITYGGTVSGETVTDVGMLFCGPSTTDCPVDR